MTSRGWQVVSDGPSGVQLVGKKRLKTQTKIAYAVGFLTVPVYGVGLVILTAAFIDQLMTKPPTIFLSRANPVMPKL